MRPTAGPCRPPAHPPPQPARRVTAHECTSGGRGVCGISVARATVPLPRTALALGGAPPLFPALRDLLSSPFSSYRHTPLRHFTSSTYHTHRRHTDARQRRQNNVHHTRCGPHRHTRAAHAAVPSPNTHTSLFPHVCRRRPRVFSFVLLISRDLEAKVDEREAGHAHVHAHTTHTHQGSRVWPCLLFAVRKKRQRPHMQASESVSIK